MAMKLGNRKVTLRKTRTSLRTRSWIQRHKAGLARVEKLAVRSGYEPRKVWRPNLSALRKLRLEIEDLPLNRRLTVGQFNVYARTVERLYRRQRRNETLVSQVLHRLRQINYRMRLTNKLANHRDLDQLLVWLISRKGPSGKNVHASALAQIGRDKLRRSRADYAGMGRKGADARWRRFRQDAGPG
jgi:hypothetical protein